MKVQKEFVLREIAGDYVIIPTGKTVLSFNGLITVNEVGADLWKMLQSEVTFDDLLHGILNHTMWMKRRQERISGNFWIR